VTGYSYEAFCGAVEALHGSRCWVVGVLAGRGAAVPSGLLRCDGQVDGHHLIGKNRIKQELPSGTMGPYLMVDRDPPKEVPGRSLGEILNDGRNGVPACRRHHDLVERALVRIAREELPAEVFEFAAELGLGGWLERYYPRVAA
jgi:hypothetical protein